MGQYYRIANLDKREYLDPIQFGDGLKLMEFALGSSGVMSALAVLLASSNGQGGGDLWIENEDRWGHIPGRWCGDRIAVVGDYDDAEDSPGCGIWDEITRSEDTTPMEDLTDKLQDRPPPWKDISWDALGALMEDEYARKEIEKNLAHRARWDKRMPQVWEYLRPGQPMPEIKE